ncbi:hypothetical protein STEG23_009576, partial [Scotinomys teguina]
DLLCDVKVTHKDFKPPHKFITYWKMVNPGHQLQMIDSQSAMSQQTRVRIQVPRAIPAPRDQSKVRGPMAAKAPPSEEENPRVKCRGCGAFGHTARSKRCPIKCGYGLPVPQPLEAKEEKENQDPRRAQALQTTGTRSQAERDKKLSQHPASHKDRQIPNTSLRAPGKKPPRGSTEPGQNPRKKPRLTPPGNSPHKSNSRPLSKTSSPESQSQSQPGAKSLGGKEAPERGKKVVAQVPSGTEQTSLRQCSAAPASAKACVHSQEPSAAHGAGRSLRMIFKRLHVNPGHQLQMIDSHSAMSQQTRVRIPVPRAIPAPRDQSKVRGPMAAKAPPSEEENPRVKCRGCGAFGHTARSKRCPIKCGYGLPVPQPLEAKEEKENQDPRRAQALQTTGTRSQAERDKKLSQHPASHKDRQIPNTSLRAPGKKPPRGSTEPGQNPRKKPRLTPPGNSPHKSNSRPLSKTSSPESQSQSQPGAKSLGGKEAPERGKKVAAQVPSGTEQTSLRQCSAAPASAKACVHSQEPSAAHGAGRSLRMIFKRLHGNFWTSRFVTEEPLLPREKETSPSESPAPRGKEAGAHSRLPGSVLYEELRVSSSSEESDGE